MKRLTTNKAASKMNMVELAHNSCFAKDRNATYRDFEEEVDTRDFIRRIGTQLNIFEKGCAELIDDESLDETMIDYLQYGYDTKEGLLALFYRNLWAQADLYETLKHYEDLEEQGLLLKLPCKVGDTVYRICPKCNDKHDESCENCAWRYAVAANGCDVYGLWSDGQFPAVKCTIVPYRVTWNYIPDLIKHYNKTVFITRAEAEEALKR